MADGNRRERRWRDETLICERCGVTFLWTAEERRQLDRSTERAPSHCPGCRTLMPAPGRERGVVKWYNPRKKYGFIVHQKAPEIFTHRSAFEDVGRLQEGDLVEFTVVEGKKGPMAASVRLLQRESAGAA